MKTLQSHTGTIYSFSHDKKRVVMGESFQVDPRIVYERYITTRGISRAHIEAFDQWIGTTIYDNICSCYGELKDARKIMFSNLTVSKPYYELNNMRYPLTPAYAKRELLTYGGALHVNMSILDSDMKEVFTTKEPLHICTVPIMVKSVKCNLRNLTQDEMRRCGEDPLDYGGYFIIRGMSYMLPHIEKLGLNVFITVPNKNDKTETDITYKTICQTRRTIQHTMFYSPKNDMYMFHFPSMYNGTCPRSQDSFNVLHVLHAVSGGVPVADIRTLVKRFMMRSLTENQKEKLLDRLSSNHAHFDAYPDAMAVIGGKLDSAKFPSDSSKAREVKRLIRQDVFPHVTGYFKNHPHERANDMRNMNKVYMIVLMLTRLLEKTGGHRPHSDRDSWANKMVEGAAKSMEKLLRGVWRKMVGNFKYRDGDTERNYNTLIDSLTKSTITEDFIKSFTSSRRPAHDMKVAKNDTTQLIVKESTIFTLSMLSEVTVATLRTDRQKSIRTIQNSQFGFIDPVYCTDGRNVGMRKNMSTTTGVTLWNWGNDDTIVAELEPLCSMEMSSDGADREYAIVNGVFMGWCEASAVVRLLRRLKLSGNIPRSTAIVQVGRMVEVRTTACRLVRPLFVVDPETQMLVYKLKNLSTNDPEVLLREGAIELVDPAEQECLKIAENVGKLEDIVAKEKAMGEHNTSWLTNVAAEAMPGEAVGVVFNSRLGVLGGGEGRPGIPSRQEEEDNRRQTFGYRSRGGAPP